MTPSDRLLQIIQHMDSVFWREWIAQTDPLPDTPEGDDCKVTSAEASIASIIANYLLGYEKDKRAYHLEHLINKLRAIELNIREWDV